jgi:hypothetical protein
MTLFDRVGQPVAYLEGKDDIFLFKGTAAGYINMGAVYNYQGEHLGWFENGWVRDTKGRCVFFTNNVTKEGPLLPTKHVEPVKGLKQVKPMKSAKRPLHPKIMSSFLWSDESGEKFFKLN